MITNDLPKWTSFIDWYYLWASFIKRVILFSFLHIPYFVIIYLTCLLSIKKNSLLIYHLHDPVWKITRHRLLLRICRLAKRTIDWIIDGRETKRPVFIGHVNLSIEFNKTRAVSDWIGMPIHSSHFQSWISGLCITQLLSNSGLLVSTCFIVTDFI